MFLDNVSNYYFNTRIMGLIRLRASPLTLLLLIFQYSRKQQAPESNAKADDFEKLINLLVGVLVENNVIENESVYYFCSTYGSLFYFRWFTFKRFL